MPFNEEERQFLKDLAECDNKEEYSKVQDKYGEEKFNILKHRVKTKANKMRKEVKKDLKLYEKVEDVINYHL